MKKVSALKAITGFMILFLSYHSAEHMMLYKNSPIGFIGLLFVFFFIAWGVTRWQGLTGLATWGMIKGKDVWKKTGLGLLAGGIIYTLYFVTCLALDIVRIKEVPSAGIFLSQFGLFAFGTFFASLAEDVLTRGYLFHFLQNKMNAYALVVVSALVYVLNHIHRLQDGIVVLTYLFIIGLFLMLAMVRTGNIWLTLGLHWSGNIVYQVSNHIIQTESGNSKVPEMGLYIGFLLVLIPVTYLISRNNESKNRHTTEGLL